MYNHAVYSGLLRLSVATVSQCFSDGFCSTFAFLSFKSAVFRLPSDILL